MSEVRIFSGKSASFDSVGEKLDAVVCIPHRILNGAYNGTISIPFDSVNSDMFVFGAVVRCSRGKVAGVVQFDLYRLGQPSVQIAVGGSYKTADLWQISNDLGRPKIMSKYLDAQTGQQALTALLTASADEQRFSGTTDITAINNLRLELMSPQAGLMNTAVPCFINTWGGELERDNFAVNAWQRLGSDKGYQIELGKNLKGVTETPTGTGYTNRIIPSCKWGAMDSSVLTALKADIDAEKAANITLANDEKDAAYLAADTERDATVDSATAEKTRIVADALAVKNAEFDQADAVYNAAPATAQAAKDAAQAQAEAVYDGTPQKALLLKNDMQANAEAQYLIDHDAAVRTAAYVYADEVYNFTIADMDNVRSIAYAAADAAYDYAMSSRADVRTNAKTVADNKYDAVVAAETEKLANITAGANEKQTAAEAVADTLKAAKIAQAQLYADEMKAVADKRFSDLADERKKDVFLPEGYIDSPNPNVWDNLKHTKYYPCESIRIGEMNTDTGVVDYPDLESAYNAMRSVVANLYTMGADVPGVSVKIDFVNLGDTKEYKKVAMLQSLDVQLGDTIHCKYYDRDISLRVCEDYWNSLSDRYESITIGDVVQNIAQSMYAQDVSLEGLKSEMNATLKQGELYNRCSITHKEGFVAEATVGANEIKTAMNATEGISIYKGTAKIFYIDSATGNIVISGTATSADMAALGNLITALDSAAVKKGVSYAGAAISATSGFTNTATINGHTVVLNASSANGFEIKVDGVKKFFVGSDGRVYATSIGNTPGYFAEIGIHDENGGGSGMDLFYNNALFCSIDYLTGGGFAFYDKNGKQRFSADATSTRLSDAAGQNRFYADATTTRLFDAAGVNRFYADATENIIYDATAKMRYLANESQTAYYAPGAANTYTQLTPTQQRVVIGGIVKQTL